MINVMRQWKKKLTCKVRTDLIPCRTVPKNQEKKSKCIFVLKLTGISHWKLFADKNRRDLGFCKNKK